METEIEKSVVEKITKSIPDQLCPKCNGEGIVSKPPYVPWGVDHWVSTSISHVCDMCKGAQIIPQFILKTKNQKQ